MSDEFDNLVGLVTYFQTLLIIITAILLDRFVTLSNTANPLIFFRLLFNRIALKVNSTVPQQAMLAGALSLVALILPIIVIIFIVREFAYYTFIIDILLLWTSLQYRQDFSIIMQTQKALNNDKKELAKNLLSSEVLRDTAVLSKLGVIKAGIECTYLRYQHQQITPILLFITLGPILAFVYRLLYESHHQWHTKLSKFKFFGRASFYMSKFFQLPGVILCHILFPFVFNNRTFFSILFKLQFWRELNNLFRFSQQTSGLWVLSIVLKKDTGGAVMYENKKQRRIKFVGSSQARKIEPDLTDLNLILKMTSIFTYFLVTVFGIICVLRFFYEF